MVSGRFEDMLASAYGGSARVPALLCLDPKLRSDEGPNAEEPACYQAEFDGPQELEDWHSGHQETARRSYVRCSAQG